MKDWQHAVKEIATQAPAFQATLLQHFGRDITVSEATYKASIYQLFADASPEGTEILKAIANKSCQPIETSRKRMFIKHKLLSFFLTYLPAPEGSVVFTEDMMRMVMAMITGEKAYTHQCCFVDNPTLHRWLDVQSDAFKDSRHRLLSSFNPKFIQTLLDNDIFIIQSEDDITRFMGIVGWDGCEPTFDLLIDNIKKRFPDYDLSQITSSELLTNAVIRQSKALVKKALSLFDWPQSTLNRCVTELSKQIVNYKDGEWHADLIDLLMSHGASPTYLSRPMVRGWLGVEGRSYMARIKEMRDAQDAPHKVEALLLFYAKDNKGNLNKYLHKCPQWQAPLVISVMGAALR